MVDISKAVFAAGCFWGVQSTFDAVPGVVSTQVGYTGGHIENPTYEMVCSLNTGHAEAIEIEYNPKKVSYEMLLDIFFSSHNPTTKNRQGPDVGDQYRSAVFYLTKEQKEAALKKIDELNKAKVFNKPIVTEVVKAEKFYPAEEYHQKYNQKKGGASCAIHRNAASSPVPSQEDLKKNLSPEQYDVLINKGTERPFTGKYLNNKEDGTYACGACGNPIFNSEFKYDSGSGWPSFDRAIPGSVRLKTDFSHGMIRTEVVCSNCGSHLGHMFDDGPTETGERFCINSLSMNFEKKDK